MQPCRRGWHACHRRPLAIVVTDRPETNVSGLCRTRPVQQLYECCEVKSALDTKKAAWNIALMIESQVVRIGMEEMLRRIESVATIQSYDLDCLRAMLAAEPDVLIITSDEWQSLGRLDEETRGNLPRLLVLGEEPYEWTGELYAALPVDGFLSLQTLSAESAEESLARTATGELPMPPALARRLLATNGVRVSRAAARPRSLTPRESQTLSLLADGLSNKQIARKLGISVHGAKRLVGSILLKLGAPNRTGAVATAQKVGLV